MAAAVFCLPALFVTDTSFAQGESPGNKVLIGFKGETGRQFAQQRRNIVSSYGGEVHHSFHIIPVVSARIPEQALAKLKEHPQVAYIEDDGIVHVLEQYIPSGINKIGTNGMGHKQRRRCARGGSGYGYRLRSRGSQ